MSRFGAGFSAMRWSWTNGVVENFDAQMLPGGWTKPICRSRNRNSTLDSEGQVRSLAKRVIVVISSGSWNVSSA